MREKKKSLRLKKHVIANLRRFTIHGGGRTNPCNPTDTDTNPSDACPTEDVNDETCNSNTTKTNIVTTPENPCDPLNNTVLMTGPRCP